MNKYWQIFRINIYHQFADRAESILWAVEGGVGSFVGALPWLLIGTQQDTVGDYSLRGVAMYYFITYIMWYISGGSFGWGVSNLISGGNLSNYLTRPIFPFANPIVGEQAWKLSGFIYSVPILLLLIHFTVGFDINLIDINILPYWILFIPATILIFGSLEFIKGLMTFWLTKITGITALNEVLNVIFGGIIAPIYLLPVWLQNISTVLPFQYIFGFPTAVLIGEVTKSQIINGLVISYLWVIVLGIITFGVYKLGIRKYESVGN